MARITGQFPEQKGLKPRRGGDPEPSVQAEGVLWASGVMPQPRPLSPKLNESQPQPRHLVRG